MSRSDTIARLIDEVAPKIAVIFAASEPRLIGTLTSAPTAAAIKAPVDAILLSQQLSATYISRATCHDRLFVAVHG
jgi:hypothetical protein